ncbi:MAG: DUF2147 domain-containing protein [Acidobacteriota bacterium]
MKPVWRSSRSALLLAALLSIAVPYAIARAALLDSVWLMDGKVAVQIFDCNGLLCGRVLWLQIPRDPQGVLNRDKRNPDPALRQRGLCGLSVFWNLHPDGPNRWKDGWFYNPDDGRTYKVTAELTSDDLVTRRASTRCSPFSARLGPCNGCCTAHRTAGADPASRRDWDGLPFASVVRPPGNRGASVRVSSDVNQHWGHG